MPQSKNPAPKPIRLPEENSTAIPVTAKEGCETKKRIAWLYLTPELNAARLALAYNPKSSLDLAEVIGTLREHRGAVNSGDLSQAEAMLLNQAHALQAMFVNLAERAKKQVGIPQIQCLLGLALRAQSQCRATLQTLADVKFPKSATFIRQANLAHQQQVNNAMAPPEDPPTRARKAEPTSSNELLEDKRRDATTLRMDTGTTCPTSGDDPCLETVATGERAKNR